jgi:hypothetical protein
VYTCATVVGAFIFDTIDFRYEVWKDRMGENFHGRCEMCFVKLDCLEPCGWHAAHNVAWTKGGSHELTNRRVSCPKCNQSTSTLTFDEEGKARRALSKQMKFTDTETVAI